ncbi:signal peptidase I [Undibacterium sp. SXout7W]|uniref:signal peptidase I n=1 Tax=Undibacterium sp. SXout7W TaxID=3413049 RepID=UPI003BF045EE
MINVRKLLVENRGFLMFLFGMILVRSALADYYTVPTSSMYPTLLEGDRVICNRIAYDVKLPFTDIVLKHMADPERGDVVTFSSPEDGTRLIKRLIALPGDTVEMRDERLFINGQSATYQPLDLKSADHLTPVREYAGQQLVYQEQLGTLLHKMIVMPEREAMRNFGPVKVPQGQYLMLGDNRDNSKDSRFIGLVKRELITGRVQHLLYSLNADHYYLPRTERFGAAL